MAMLDLESLVAEASRSCAKLAAGLPRSYKGFRLGFGFWGLGVQGFRVFERFGI